MVSHELPTFVMFFQKNTPFFLVASTLVFGTTSALAQVPSLFTDQTEAAGISLRHKSVTDWSGMGVGTGAAWVDMDRDGDLDLYLTQGEGANKLYLNDGDGFFVDYANEWNAADSLHYGAAVAVADYDNDGWPDLYLGNSDQDVLLRNNGGAGFEDVTESMGLDSLTSARTTSVAWGDYNADGYVDLYLTHHLHIEEGNTDTQDRLFYNDRGERLIDVSHLLGLENLDGHGFIGGWTDFDNDGDLDILLINDCGFQRDFSFIRLFRNRGGDDPLNWKFDERSRQVGAEICFNGMGLATGDYNRDGWMDYYASNIGEQTILLHNREGVFIERAREAGVLAVDPDGATLWSWGANFIDFDLDGYQDIYLVAGTVFLGFTTEEDPQPNLLFKNEGDETFLNVSQQSGINLPGRSRTSVFGDYDGDGDPDLLLVNNNQEAHLFRNEHTRGHHWLIVDLEGAGPPFSNTMGIGARISITGTDGVTQYWEVRSGTSLGGGDDVAAYFGLADEAGPVSVQVKWPSGTVQEWEQVGVDQRIRLRESPGSGTDNRKEHPPLTESLNLFPNPFSDLATLEYDAPLPGRYVVRVYDMLGRIVWEESQWVLNPGTYSVWLEGRSGSGTPWPAGVYLVSVRSNSRLLWNRTLVKL